VWRGVKGNMKKKTLTRNIWPILFIGGGVWLIVSIIIQFTTVNERHQQHLPFTYKVPKDIAQVFNADHLDSFEVTEVWNSKIRTLIAKVTFGRRYALFAFKLESLVASNILDSIDYNFNHGSTRH
jgi:hypothetical protein